MHTSQVILNLLESNPNIASINIIRFKPAPQIQANKTCWGQKEIDIFEKTLLMRAQFKIPFWLALMISNIDNKNWSEECVKAAIRHNKNSDIIRISPKQYMSNSSDYELESIGINSAVTLLDGSVWHIPMIDFHINKSNINEDIVCTVSKLLVPEGGYVLDSGNSYHFIGKHLISKENILDLLAKSIQFSPIVDEVWASHQLIERSCTLRIGYKNGVLPTVIKSI